VIWVALSTENVLAAWPPNLTDVAPVKFVPVRTTTAPVLPEAGAKLATVGALGGGVVLFEAALPQAAIPRSRAKITNTRPIRRMIPAARTPPNLLSIKDKSCVNGEISGGMSMATLFEVCRASSRVREC
jgi:hypothetical protein